MTTADDNLGPGSKWIMVKLGRDAAIRPARMDSNGTKVFQCVCCFEFTLGVVDECDICGNCGWEDWYECHDDPKAVIRPNYISLQVARNLYARFGAGAACAANRAKGLTITELESMTEHELRALKTLDQESRRTESRPTLD